MNEYEKSLNDLVKDLQAKGQSRIEKMQEQNLIQQQHFSNQALSISMLKKELGAYKDLSTKLESINNELKNRLIEQQKELEKEKKERRRQFYISTFVSLVGIIAAALVGILF